MTDSPLEPWLQAFLEARRGTPDLELESWADSVPELSSDRSLRAALERRLAAHDEESERGEALPGGGAAPDHDPGSPAHAQAGALLPGRRVGRFVLIAQVGAGGMGQVWEAEDTELRRRVALKFLLRGGVLSGELERFIREARAGGRCSHPSLVATYGNGEDEGLAWIAQEFVDGPNLAEAIRERREAPSVAKSHYREVAELVAKIADGLEAAHLVGVIHRDLKPANILITEGEVPKVTDFGLARLTGETHLSVEGELAGTYHYMSPEQVAAKRIGLDHRTDIFSLGVVMYELLTLRKPFDGDTSQQVMQQIITEDAPNPMKVRSQCPRELAVICGKALEKSVERRYETMAAFAADLRRHLANEPILAKPPGPMTRAVKWARRNPAVTAAAAVGFVALGVVTALLQVQTRLADEMTRLARSESEAKEVAVAAKELADAARNAATRQAYSASIHAATAALENGNVADARRRLEACPEALRGWEWGHLDLASDSSLHTLSGGERALDGSVAWNPAGTRIVSGAGPLRLWDPSTGECLRTLDEDADDVDSVAWSPDGTRIVSSSSGGTTLRIWDPSTGECLHTLEGFAVQGASFQCRLAWNPAGTLIAATSGDASWDDRADRTVRVWDASTGECLHTLQGHESFVWSVSWNPAGTRIVSGSNDKTLRVWDASTGECLHTLEGEVPMSDSFAQHPWSPAGTHVVSVSGGAAVRIWNAATGECLHTLEGHGIVAGAVAWNPAGTRLVSGAEDGTLQIWDVATGESLHTLQGHEDQIVSAAWNAAGTRIVSASRDSTLRLWDPSTGECLQTFRGHTDSVRSVRWSVSGTRIASTSTGDALRVWNVLTGECQSTLTGHEDAVSCFAWSPDGTRIVSVSEDSTLRIWDASTGERSHPLGGHEARVWSVTWTGDGTRLVSASADRTLRTWNPSTGECVHTLDGLGREVGSVAWNPDGTRVLSGSSDGMLRIQDPSTGESVHALDGLTNVAAGSGSRVAWSPAGSRVAATIWEADGIATTLRIWDASTGECLHSIEANRSMAGEGAAALVSLAASVAWNPDGTRIVTAPEEGALRIWDASTGECLHALEGHEGSVGSVAWNPTGTLLAFGAQGDIRVWDPSTGELLRTLEDHEIGHGPVAWNPAGTHIASTAEDNALRIWDVSTGERQHILEGHDGPVSTLAWNPAGTRIVSGGQDKTLRVWDPVTGECLQTLEGHSSRVTSVTWDPAGTRIASGAADGTLRIWESRLEDALPMWRAASKRRGK
ncbi:MAG: serine/threonine-protein kinase [Planctomycetota bacterium]|nr:serine/threonine-protein kinase [Planctomycetota bacterium]